MGCLLTIELIPNFSTVCRPDRANAIGAVAAPAKQVMSKQQIVFTYALAGANTEAHSNEKVGGQLVVSMIFCSATLR